MYNDKSVLINNDANDLGLIATDMSSVDLGSVWSGSAFGVLSASLHKDIVSFLEQTKKLNLYGDVLNMMSQYVDLEQQIQALRIELTKYSGNDKESIAARAAIFAKIAVLTNQKNALQADIQQKLSSIRSNVSDDVSSDNDVVTYSSVPLFYQSDYTNVKYGTGTLATHGCGITSLAMVASYYNDKEILPDELAKNYAGYGSSSGTDHMIFEKTADDLNLPFEEHIHYSTPDDLQAVVTSLEEGGVVIAKAKKSSIFTESGHYIVLTGVTEDGKILVNDPNKYNYKEFSDNPGASSIEGEILTDGFSNGFDLDVFKQGKISDFFIYSPKS